MSVKSDNKKNMKDGMLDNTQRCPKCGGNFFIYNDFYGWYEQCLQCSYSLDLVEICKVPTGG